ncbi:hypothetical protein SSP531S_44480 [Streptomyces spongiicola]|uniref:Uncharacterized protein n=1 Tax=Streptomyces spongiicola TaxID=1690221 RepID=A0A2S1ZAM9_9ACTN|nr:hypothetical protein [Streptomyces spongiicola]AWK12978.1 hypothetical protein DDQ41_17575 [Streptomyces spongiicola]GBQ02983.1 hypothetical protein SSP531S_44480 [Streptomyces spongiicola]
MESGPAVFAGTVFALFGAALLIWTGARVRHRAPVAHGVNPATAATLSMIFGTAFLLAGLWCLSRV